MPYISMSYPRMKHLDKMPSHQSRRNLDLQVRPSHFPLEPTCPKTEPERLYNVQLLRPLSHQMNLRRATKKHSNRAYGRNLKGDFQAKIEKFKLIKRGVRGLVTFFHGEKAVRVHAN